MNKLSHTNSKGKATMVDVSNKETSLRIAKAQAVIKLSKIAYELLISNNNQKGDVLTVAKIAGINAAKQCGTLIPLCHNIFISKASIEFELNAFNNTVIVYSEVKTNSTTGVEMEALTSVTVAALTVYDMLKAVDKSITITDIYLLEKQGGKSGNYYCNKNI